MRRLFILPSILLAGGGIFLSREAPCQSCPTGALACTEPNAPGSSKYEDSVSDLAYHSGLQQVWALEGPLPAFNGLTVSRLTVFNEGLSSIVASKNGLFPEAAFGIAEIPAHLPAAGNFYLLCPNRDNAVVLVPAIGIMDPNGNLLDSSGNPSAQAKFIPIIDPKTGKAPLGFYHAMDVHPSDPEIVIYDDGSYGNVPQIAFVKAPADESGAEPIYNIVRGPFPLEGRSTYFGGGVTYSSTSTVLVVAQFRQSFQAKLALEYEIVAGQYTGKCVLLDQQTGRSDPPMIPLGLDTGSLNGDPAIFFYDAYSDRIIATPFNYLDAPGPVQGLNPACTVESDGRVRLTWTNRSEYGYDLIVVHENGCAVATLPGDATEYVTTVPPVGKYEFCLETLVGGGENPIRICCEGQSGGIPPVLPQGDPGVSRVDVDSVPGYYHLPMGLTCPKVLQKKEDFELYLIGSQDNGIRAIDLGRNIRRTIGTQPAVDSIVEGNTITNIAASAIALMDVTVQGTAVPMYVLLDLDGPNGDLVPSASFHYLKDTTLPGGAAPIPAGTMYKNVITSIDFTSLPEGLYILSWDSDREGNLIAVDDERKRLIKIHYDPEAHSLRATAEAPIPIPLLTNIANPSYPLGPIAVLPSGNYLLAAGDPLDSTLTRAFLLTPLSGAGIQQEVRLVGYAEGLKTFGQFFPPAVIGRLVGPDWGFGLSTTFFQEEGTEGTGMLIYDMLNFSATDRRTILGDFLIELTCAVAHPDLVAEQMIDLASTVGPAGFLETGILSPGFADQVQRIDYHYMVFNPSDRDALPVSIYPVLDGEPAAELIERGISIPPGRYISRTAAKRAEKSFELRVENANRTQSRAIRALVGATGVKSGAPPPPKFRRGDANDDGKTDLSDAITTLGYLFQGLALPACPDAADVDDTGKIDITDPINLLGYLFQGGISPPDPGPVSCGADPTDDGLSTCASAKCP